MRVWADVYTSGDVKIGSAVVITSATVTKVLDSAGSFTLTFPAASEAMFDLLQLERKVRIYSEQDEQPRLFGNGVIRSISIDESSGGAKVTVSGPDSLDALSRKSVLLGRSYNNLPIPTIGADLVGLVEGWSLLCTDTGNQSARFDGMSVLKALIRMAEEKGLHLREGLDPLTVELGAFGDDNGIRALKPGGISVELTGRNEILLIEKIMQKSMSQEVTNWIVPLGAGEGAAALNLGESSFSVQSITGPDGNDLYYLKDQDSIDAYGQTEKVVTFKEITPIENSESARQLAADALYDAATAWLERNKAPQATYSLSAKKSKTVIRPGDKIQVIYKGLVETESGYHTYLNINDLFWVMKVTESISDSGAGIQLELSTIDREARTIDVEVGRALEAVDVRNVSVQPTFNLSNVGPYKKELDSSHSFTIPLKITNAVSVLERCLLTVRSRSFRATATPENFHTHLVARSSDGTAVGALALRTFSILEQTTGTVFHFQAQADVGASARFFNTASSSEDTINYGIHDDTEYPDAVEITVDGQTVATGLGDGGVAFDEEINITGFLTDAPGGLRQEHQIEFSCEAGQGEIEVQIELYSHITPIKLD